MKVDLKGGRAIVLAAAGKGFDPARIPKAVRDAGFTSGEIELTAVGVLRREAGCLVLELPGAPAKLALSGGARVRDLEQRTELFGQRVRVRGRFLVLTERQIPGLTVESWEPAPSSS